jgi:tripartite-type tricarboxylate transporter receptor subunit TctC
MTDKKNAASISRRTALLALSASAFALSPLARVNAQAKYPDRPVRIVLPFGPGGVADVTARLTAEKLSNKLGKQFVIENMPGAGGITAARAVINAAPDGYTLGLCSNGTAISVDMFRKLPFDPMKQFQMVSMIGAFDLVFAVNAASNYKSLQDVIAAAKDKPGKLNLGTIAVGSTQNLGAELFKSMSGADLMIVPYKNSPDIVVALLRNDVDMTMEFPPAIEGQVRDGKLRILATSGEQRSPFLPNVPTAIEAGVAGYNVTSWNGIFAPAGTPQEIVDILNKAIREAVAEPDVKEKFSKLGVRAEASSPDELKQRLKNDIEKWAAVIQKAGIPLH